MMIATSNWGFNAGNVFHFHDIPGGRLSMAIVMLVLCVNYLSECIVPTKNFEAQKCCNITSAHWNFLGNTTHCSSCCLCFCYAVSAPKGIGCMLVLGQLKTLAYVITCSKWCIVIECTNLCLLGPWGHSYGSIHSLHRQPFLIISVNYAMLILPWLVRWLLFAVFSNFELAAVEHLAVWGLVDAAGSSIVFTSDNESSSFVEISCLVVLRLEDWTEFDILDFLLMERWASIRYMAHILL